MDYTILIQGKIEEETISHYAGLYRSKCLVSTWEDHVDVDTLGIRTIYSVRPKYNGIQNMNLQYASTLAGLKEVSTSYVVKVRGDEYYSNIEYAVEESVRRNRIECLPVFFRPWDFCSFHISDHFICGRTDCLKEMFSRVTCRYPEPERNLTMSFLEWAEDASISNLGKEHMKKYFHILDINNMKDYKVTYNQIHSRWINNWDGCGPTLWSIDDL